MKNFRLFLITALVAATIISCNDSKGDYPNYAQFVSVYPLTGDDFYVKTDSDKSLYPSDKTRIRGYKVEAATPAQRAVIYYNLLDQKAEGYDYSIQPYILTNIYTNAAKIISTTEELEKLTDDKTSYYAAELNKKFLTIEVAYPVIDNSQHTFDLIVDTTDPAAKPTKEGYLDVQLRHNAGSDSGGRDRNFYISFDLSALKDRLDAAKGITLRVNTQLNGVQYLQINLPAEK